MAGQTWETKMSEGMVRHYGEEMLRQAQQRQTRFRDIYPGPVVKKNRVRVWLTSARWFWEENVCGAVSVLMGKSVARDWED